MLSWRFGGNCSALVTALKARGRAHRMYVKGANCRAVARQLIVTHCRPHLYNVYIYIYICPSQFGPRGAQHSTYRKQGLATACMSTGATYQERTVGYLSYKCLLWPGDSHQPLRTTPSCCSERYPGELWGLVMSPTACRGQQSFLTEYFISKYR